MSDNEELSKENRPKYEDVKVFRDGIWTVPEIEPNDWTAGIADILLSENLVVLCGLGTSLAINTKETKIAPTMPDLWEAVSKLPNFKDIVKQIKFDTSVADVELLLSRSQLHLLIDENNETLTKFVKAAEEIILQKCQFPGKESDLPVHELFLRKIARRSIRQPRMRLFTTNYDLCFEAAAARAGFITIDGFSHSAPQVFDSFYFSYDFVKRDGDGTVPDFIPNVFLLLKLHGSVDWKYQSEQSVIRAMDGKRAMIYPRYGKFESSYQQPFFEMMSRFQASLRQPNTGLIIIGYGCKDNHINEPLLSAIRANVGMKFAFVDPGLEKDEPNAVHEMVKDLQKKGDSRVFLLSTTFEIFTKYIPDLVAETELETHTKRTRR